MSARRRTIEIVVFFVGLVALGVFLPTGARPSAHGPAAKVAAADDGASDAVAFAPSAPGPVADVTTGDVPVPVQVTTNVSAVRVSRRTASSAQAMRTFFATPLMATPASAAPPSSGAAPAPQSGPAPAPKPQPQPAPQPQPSPPPNTSGPGPSEASGPGANSGSSPSAGSSASSGPSASSGTGSTPGGPTP